MSAESIIGTIVIFESVFRGYVLEEQEFSAFKDLDIGCIDAVEFMPAGSCTCMQFPSFSFASQAISRRGWLS